ncbi:hypothetical protein CGLO_15506 [Colletotrichum gloeosporioides Cg-14]
MRVLP